MISLFIFSSDTRSMLYGVGTYVSQLTSSLLKYPEIEIYHVKYSSKKYKEFKIFKNENGITNIYIPTSPLLKKDDKYYIKYQIRVIDLITEIVNNLPHVCFQFNDPTTLTIVREIKKRWSFPVISVVHMANWQLLTIGNKQEFMNIWKDKDKYNLDFLKELLEEKELYENSDSIISVTEYMKEFITEFYSIQECRVVTIRNGIDSSGLKVPDKVEKIKIKKQLGISETEKILIFSGRLDKGKGLHFLLEAFNKVFEKNKNIRLIILGEDSGMERISHFLRYCKDSWNKITFTGFLRYDDVMRFYQIADIGIIPSIYDHCPYTVLEMMAYNIPMIISNTDGLNEMLSENQSIYLEPKYDEQGQISFNTSDMAEEILSLAENKEKAFQITKDYQNLLKSKFSIDSMTGKMYNILCRLSGETNIGLCKNQSLESSI